MGCGISAAVNGLDWYLVSLEQDTVKSAEPKSFNVQPPDKTASFEVQPTDTTASFEVKPPDKPTSFAVQFNDEITGSSVQRLPDERKTLYDQLYNLSISGVYSIKCGDVTYTLVLLQDGRIVIDGHFAQSVIYKQGRTELKFVMRSAENDSNSLVSGTINFTDSTTLNGSFNFHDNNSSSVVGVKDEAEELKSKISDSEEGKQCVVIDESSFKKVKELERQLEKYQRMDLYQSISEQTRKAEQLEERIKQQVRDIEDHKARLEKEKEEHGADSEQCRAVEIELESKCLALASDQQQYDVTLQYIRTRTADLFDYNMLTEQFDDLLNAMFRGESGNDIENQLEETLEEAEDAERQHATSFDIEERIWENAKGINERLLQALNKWSSLESDGHYTSVQREYLAKQTRVLLVQTIDELIALETILKQYDTYRPEDECMLRLFEFRDNIFTMFESSEGVSDGVDTIMFCQKCTRRIEQWVYEKFRIKEGQEKLTTLQKVVLQAKLKLKQERRSLIENWLTEHVGSFEREATIVSNQSDEIPDKITVETNGLDQPSTGASEEANIGESYEQIVARVQAWEKKSDLDGIRAELQLQDKMRARRKRQRHQRAQKLIEVQSPTKSKSTAAVSA